MKNSMIVKLTVAAGAFIVLVSVAGVSALVAYRGGYANGLGVAERVIADRVVAGVEMASALRQHDTAGALRLTEMKLDSDALLLRNARSNVGIVIVEAFEAARPEHAIILARRYRALVPPDGPMRDEVSAMVREERDDPAVRSTPRLATLAAAADRSRP